MSSATVGAFLPHAFPRANRNARALLGGMQRLLGGRQRRFLGKEVTWLRAALPSEPPPLFSCFSRYPFYLYTSQTGIFYWFWLSVPSFRSLQRSPASLTTLQNQLLPTSVALRLFILLLFSFVALKTSPIYLLTYYPSPPGEGQLHEGWDFCLFCSLLCH